MSTLFKINEFAKIHSTTRDTLLWYDKIDLFKPYMIKGNGYRYYSLDQSPLLQTILLCRQLDFTVNEIKSLLTGHSEDISNIINQKTVSLNNAISKMHIQLNHLRTMSYVTNFLQGTDIIQIVELPEISGVLLPHACSCFNNSSISPYFNQNDIPDLFNSQNIIRGIRIPIESILAQTHYNCDDFYIDFTHSFALAHPISVIFPKGHYIQTLYYNSQGSLFQCYHQILKYAQSNNLHPSGYAYEIHIQHFLSSNCNYDSHVILIRLHLMT